MPYLRSVYDMAAAENSWVLNSVPAAQLDDAAAVAALLPPAEFRPAAPFVVRVGGESLTIPGRIYCPELPADDLSALPATQRAIIHRVYTRHHDGRVRRRHLRSIIDEPRPWVAPFVVRLVGEYVADILLDIRTGLVEVDVPGTRMHAVYGEFGAANPEFITLTRQRVASYWNCYHRNLWADRAHYPGTTVIESVMAAAGLHRSVGPTLR